MKFNSNKEVVVTENLAGGKAIPLDKKMELVFAVLATFLKDEYYESGNERMERIINLIKENDPVFVAKLAVVARNKFHLRSVSHLLLGELAKLHKGDDLLTRAMQQAVERPDDLLEIAAVIGVDKLTKQFKKGFRRAILKFNRYNLAKYRGEGKKIKMVDLFNLCHPKDSFATDDQKQAWKDLMFNVLKSEDTWEAMKSSGQSSEETFGKLLAEKKLGYMAALRNLRTIEQDCSQTTKDKVCELISNPEAVKSSKLLPFRFLKAYENVQSSKILGAINKALELSLDNVPSFEGKTLIAVDVSGSMSGMPIEIASIFAAALFKKNDAEVVIYSDRIHNDVKLISSDSLLTLSNQIKKINGGGTNTSLVFEYALKQDHAYDRIIVLSDNESWMERGWGGSTNSVYNATRGLLGDPKIFCIDLLGYGTFDIGGRNTYHLTGWSDKLLDLLKNLEDGETIINYVDNIKL